LLSFVKRVFSEFRRKLALFRFSVYCGSASLFEISPQACAFSLFLFIADKHRFSNFHRMLALFRFFQYASSSICPKGEIALESSAALLQEQLQNNPVIATAGTRKSSRSR
jgi:hypothetical protein